jgi:hypothetical protein
MWIVAMLVGFVIWWPIGLMILSAITVVALAQQARGGFIAPPVAPPRVAKRPVPLHWSEVQVVEPPLKQIEQRKIRRLR